MLIEPLKQTNAVEIADNWKYPGIYSFYDMTEDPEDYKELITPELRSNHYYQVTKHEELFGFFALYPSDDTMEMGIGINPDYTGKGHGETFIQMIIDYILENFDVNLIKLSVVDFNIRAQKVYERNGFIKTREYLQETNQSTYKFIQMEKRV